MVFYSSPLHTARITDTQNICCHMTTMQFFINILNILRIEQQQLNEEIKEEIPDDDLKGTKHVGLFIKSVLSDFSVT